MLPKPVVPEKGSRKVLNGVEVWTIHNFTTEKGNVYETIDGSYILPNGQPIQDKTILEFLPEEHRQKALAWWENRFGAETMIEPVPETPESIRVQIEVLSRKLSTMECSPEEQAMAEPVDSRKDMKEPQETKRAPGRPKMDKGLETLKQSGLAG